MLERQEDGDDFDNSDPMADNAESKPAAEAQESSFRESTSSAENPEEGEWNERIPNELPVDTAWEDIYQTSASNLPASDDDEWDFTTRTSVGESLQSHLLWQLNLAPMSDTDRLIAVTLIDSINEQGYRRTARRNLRRLRPRTGYRARRSRSGTAPHPAIRTRRHWRPQPWRVPAAAATSASGEHPWMAEAQRLVTDFIDLLGSRDYSQLMRRMKIKEDELRQVIELVQSLNPRPGSQIESSEPEYVVPDVIVRKDSDRWLVELNRSDTTPAGQPAVCRLRPPRRYQRRQHLHAQPVARSALVHQEPAKSQRDADEGRHPDRRAPARLPDHGDEAMKPLVLHDIAEAVGMHESTISRVTTQKYMHTPRGIYELKYFSRAM